MSNQQFIFFKEDSSEIVSGQRNGLPSLLILFWQKYNHTEYSKLDFFTL